LPHGDEVESLFRAKGSGLMMSLTTPLSEQEITELDEFLTIYPPWGAVLVSDAAETAADDRKHCSPVLQMACPLHRVEARISRLQTPRRRCNCESELKMEIPGKTKIDALGLLRNDRRSVKNLFEQSKPDRKAHKRKRD
jgi:hypothetical protein